MPTLDELLEAERQSRVAILRHLHSYRIIMEAIGESTALQLRDTRRNRSSRQISPTNPNDPYEVQWASNRWARRTPRTLGHPIYRVSTPNQYSNPFGDEHAAENSLDDEHAAENSLDDEHAAENSLDDGLLRLFRNFSSYHPGFGIGRDEDWHSLGSADRPNNVRRGAIAPGSPPARPQSSPPARPELPPLEDEELDPNIRRPVWERARRQLENGEAVRPQPYDQDLGPQEMSDVLRRELDSTVERLAEQAERELNHQRANAIRSQWNRLDPGQWEIIDRYLYEFLAEEMDEFASVASIAS